MGEKDDILIRVILTSREVSIRSLGHCTEATRWGEVGSFCCSPQALPMGYKLKNVCLHKCGGESSPWTWWEPAHAAYVYQGTSTGSQRGLPLRLLGINFPEPNKFEFVYCTSTRKGFVNKRLYNCVFPPWNGPPSTPHCIFTLFSFPPFSAFSSPILMYWYMRIFQPFLFWDELFCLVSLILSSIASTQRLVTRL